MLVLVLLLPACKPAAFEEHQRTYERLVVLARQEGRSEFLWLPHTAPANARRLMAQLNVRAVLFDYDAGTVYFRRGGGYTPEYGYIYRLPNYDSTATDRWDAEAAHVRGRWFFWDEG